MRFRLFSQKKFPSLIFASIVSTVTACTSTHSETESDTEPTTALSTNPPSKTLTDKPMKKNDTLPNKKDKSKRNSSNEIPFKTLKMGYSSWREEGDRGPIAFVITNQEELTKSWKSFYLEGQVPLIDFRTSTVILVHESYRTECCYLRIDRIKSMAGSPEGPDVILKLITSVPGKQCATAAALSGSLHAVTIPSKYKLKKIEMSFKTESRVDCEE